MSESFEIHSEEQLADLIGEPSELVRQKLCHTLDEAMREFIRRSPLVFISTIDEEGRVDVSPKGDAPGFVHVDREGKLQLPERPGNKLTFGFRNILRNPGVGLIFVVPGMRETLRVKGSAVLTREPGILQELSARGKPAILCTQISVSECFFHCGKAMIRSQLWQPREWTQYEDSLLVRQLAGKLEVDEGLVDSHLEDSYRNSLY